jgi:hypothetical protein
MAKRPNKKGANGSTVQQGVVLLGQPVDVAYHVPEVQPAATGRWRAEADKIAWTDTATNYACVIRREKKGGHLAYFVGLPQSHPLNGWAADAIPPGLVDLAGGLDYSAACDQTGPEDRSVCHVPSGSNHVADIWWLGASCNHITDIIPDDQEHAAKAQQLGIAQEYRDVAEVYARCIALASTLRAVENEGVEP